jgi:crotonobetainyl-CoA:carnitine CoA-transferase CaiB-like acyl-CoA transferase
MNPTASSDDRLPYAGLRVIELTHMVMGPSCGLLLGDLGADVIKIEPPGGDPTRRLLGSGAGFFAMFNRNKRSLAVDLKDARGHEVVLRLVAGADVFCENFKPGAMAALGLDYPSLSALNPRLVYVSHKGFLPGPYEHRTALDEVVQMMGGLAYMTGPPGQPLRAGSSVNDIMGGLFGALGAMAALARREKTGRGQEVQSALFENNVFLVAQHMRQFAVTGRPAAPMPARISAWGLYDVFTVKDGGQIFLAVVSDAQWAIFCAAFGLEALAGDARLRSNNDRVRARDWLIPRLREPLFPPTRSLAASRPMACRLRPSRARTTSSTTRTCAPPAAWPRCTWPATPTAAATPWTPPCPCSRSPSTDNARPCAAHRRPSANTAMSCCTSWATATARSRRCKRRG